MVCIHFIQHFPIITLFLRQADEVPRDGGFLLHINAETGYAEMDKHWSQEAEYVWEGRLSQYLRSPDV